MPGLELHPISRAGMAEAEIFAVKCKPANGIRAAAVNFVADDREALLGEMNTDLMFAPGFQLHANHGRLRTAFHNVHMSDGKLTCSFLPGLIDAISGVLRQVGSDGKIILGDSSFDHGQVTASGTVILELILEVFLRLDGLRKDQESRRFAVEPMHNEDFFRRVFPARAVA